MLSSSESSEDESVQGDKLRINQKFAKRYEDEKRYQELQRSQSLLGDVRLGASSGSDSESESSSEDEDAVALSTSLDVEIMETISRIKKKDPKIYDASTKFYTEESDDSSDDISDEKSNNKKKQKMDKKKTYKDVVRDQLLRGEVGGEEEEDDNYYDKEKALAYDQEQEKIRQSFLSSAMDSDDDDDDDDMMVPKPRSAAEVADEESRLKKAIEEATTLTKKDTTLDAKDEDFLSNYMMKKKWMDDVDLKVDKKAGDFLSRETEDELLDLEEDEEEQYEVDKFESKYNFRFEEEQDQGSNILGGGVGEVVGHARNVEGSLRRVDDKRKKQREERKERKEKEKRIKEAELRRLKNLKREELKARLTQIEEVCGVKGLVDVDNANEDVGTEKKKNKKEKKIKKNKTLSGGIDMNALEEDWDPEKHEELMRSQFNDEYYNQEDPDFAPGGKYFHPDAEDDVGEGYSAVGGWNEEYDEDDEDVNGYQDSEWHDENHDDGELGNAEMDAELYKLDYEDIVAGIPCRFKYANVEPEDYGLNIDDILDAEDSELNKYVGLKKISASYRESRKAKEQDSKLSRKRKHLREAIKNRKMEALEKEKAKEEKKSEAENSAKTSTDDMVDDTQPPKKAKRKRNKKKTIGGNILADQALGVEFSEKLSPLSSKKADKETKPKKLKRGKTELTDQEAAKKRRMDLYA